jgi:hypothetical protein
VRQRKVKNRCERTYRLLDTLIPVRLKLFERSLHYVSAGNQGMVVSTVLETERSVEILPKMKLFAMKMKLFLHWCEAIYCIRSRKLLLGRFVAKGVSKRQQLLKALLRHWSELIFTVWHVRKQDEVALMQDRCTRERMSSLKKRAYQVNRLSRSMSFDDGHEDVSGNHTDPDVLEQQQQGSLSVPRRPQLGWEVVSSPSSSEDGTPGQDGLACVSTTPEGDAWDAVTRTLRLW